jgi:hypothetical protein
MEGEHIYFEGDQMLGINFLVSGMASYVLPSFRNTSYIQIHEGQTFGIIDITSSAQINDFEMKNWQSQIPNLKRQFSVMSNMSLDVQMLSL